MDDNVRCFGEGVDRESERLEILVEGGVMFVLGEVEMVVVDVVFCFGVVEVFGVGDVV